MALISGWFLLSPLLLLRRAPVLCSRRLILRLAPLLASLPHPVLSHLQRTQSAGEPWRRLRSHAASSVREEKGFDCSSESSSSSPLLISIFCFPASKCSRPRVLLLSHTNRNQPTLTAQTHLIPSSMYRLLFLRANCLWFCQSRQQLLLVLWGSTPRTEAAKISIYTPRVCRHWDDSAFTCQKYPKPLVVDF